MDGGGKFSTAALVVALGAVGALVFSRSEPEAGPSSSLPSTTADTLVRRSTSPIALDAGREQANVVGPNVPLDDQAAQLSGRIDSTAAHGIDAQPLRRFSAQYPPQPASSDISRGSYTETEPGAQASERTPRHNLAGTPNLPTRYPYPSASQQAVPSSTVQELTQAGVAKLTLGGASAASSPSGDPIAGSQSFSAMTPIVSRNASVAVSQSRSIPSQDAPADLRRTEEEPRRFVPTRSHKICDGDTLSGLAERFYGDAARTQELFEANRKVLSHPDLLPIGAVLIIPPLPAAGEPGNSAAGASGLRAPPAARLVPKLEIRGYGNP